MKIQLIPCLLWIMFISRVVKGQSSCARTNRLPRLRCVEECDPATGCGGSGEECLCDGDCGHSCAKKGLSCGRPPRVSNARAQYPTTNFGAIVIYVCNHGFTISGASKRTCRANGKWDGVGPNCLKMCTIPDIPFSTYISEPENYNRTYRTGERIVLACKKGFKKKAGGNPIRICISGRWTQFPFKCEGTHSCKRTVGPSRTKCTQECSPESGCGSLKYECLCDGTCGYSCVEKGMSCGDPFAIFNGKLNFTGTGYNDTAHYTCDEGYSLNTDPDKRCTAKKRWDGLTPRCMKDCQDPAIPRNAKIKDPSDKYNSGYKVTFKCNEGYNQEGIATQMCFQGKWTVLPFKCSEGGCGDPGTPENGRKVGVTYSVNSKVYFGCDLGYELVGSEDRKCQTNGTWTGQQPICRVVDCGLPSNPQNGRSIGNETKFRSEIRFECDEGYDLQGREMRMCTSDKNWSGKEVTCKAVDCRRLLPPKNGSLTGKETTYPNQVEISCDEGFILRGSHRRKCQADRKWSGTAPFCDAVDCGPLNPPSNGSSTGKETTFTNTITFKCDEGFDLIGSFSRSCLANKTWSGIMSICKAVDCGRLPPPMNGSLLGEETTYPNQVQFSCDEGFILRGSHRRICQADRKWTGDNTLCKAINCGKPTLPDHGSITGTSTRYPHAITFTCEVGYEIQGSAVRRCQANGTWSGDDETRCKPVDCGSLQSPVNGTKIGEKTTFKNSMSFSCDDGFDLVGSTSRTCQADKQWSGTDTFCSAKDCEPLETPLNGTKLGSQTTYPNKVTFSCEDGFSLRGSTVRDCTADGEWSGVDTTCEANDCGVLKVPTNGSLLGLNLTTFPNSLTFTCDEGFLLKGSFVRQCQADAVWSGSETFCEAKDCGPLDAPYNGSMFGDRTTYPHEVSFTCDEGFILRESQLRRCTSDGTWSGTATECKAEDCGPLSVPVNGSSSGHDTTFPSVISFSCDAGFNMIGSHTRRCQSNGIWSGNETSCKAVDCGSLVMPMNGSSHGHLNTFPNKVYFQCDEGYTLKGSYVRICLSNGSWSGNDTSCKAVDCGRLSAPRNGSVQGSVTVFPNTIEFSCDEGFILEGSAVRRCQANATWSGKTTLCRARDCGKLPVPVNGSFIGHQTTYPNKQFFNCQEGFDLIGSTVRNCEANGKWSGEHPTCNAVDCGILPILLNGSHVGNLTTYPNKVTSYCDEGFLLRGSAERYCQANRTWNGVQTTCEAVDCGALPVLVNGSYFGNRTTYPSKVLLFCDEGFLLRGSSLRFCQANRTWSGTKTKCEAVDCGSLSAPPNGTVQGSATVFPNVLKFSCDSGFILEGSGVRRCQANGTWSGRTTLCQAWDCGNLPVPKNGSLLGNQTTYPNKLYFSCENGFDLIGSSVRKCEEDGGWSGKQPTCKAVDCGALPVLVNGSYFGNLTTYPSKVLLFCDEGFLLRGSAERLCQANRTWSGTETKCEAVDCGSLSAPLNGTVQGSATVFPNVLEFYCDSGFILEGSAVRRCQANGTWSSSTTLCQARDCGKLPVPINGSITGNQTTYTNKLSFSCDDGFDLIGFTVRRCEAGGNWSGRQPTCKVVDCGPLPVLLNGSHVGNQTVYPNKVTSSCDKGFLLRGSAERFCQANRTWSGIETKCEAVDCGPLPVPLNGSSYWTSTVFPNKAHFFCDPGFILKGSVKRRCLPSGLWSGNKTICEAVACGVLGIPVNGSMQGSKTYFPNVVKFTCDEGFIRHGSERRQCLANGSWSGNQTLCKAVDCGQVEAPRNGSLLGNYTTFPNKLHFYCDEGFMLRGSSVRSCLANATWSGKGTKCEAKDCGSLMIPKNGSMFGSQTTFPSEVSFICDQGFIMNGPEKRKCQADGTWSGHATLCAAVDCGRLLAPVNGSSYGDLTVFPESVRLSCDAGFLMSGSSVRHCQANGTWSGKKTICNAVDCGMLPAPVNGTVYGEDSTYPNSLQFTCDEGFTLHGATRRICQSNGTWSGSETICHANDCGPLMVPRNGSSIGSRTTYPNKMIFTCDEGFILIGSAVRQCQANETWNGLNTYCKAIDCGHLAVPLNGSSSGDLTMFPNTKHFTCDPGFILGGSSKRVCQANGTWSGTDTTCTAIDCGYLSSPRNGSVQGKRTSYPHNLRLSCDEGFTLLGSTKRMCQTNGTWSGIEAVCKANDCGKLVIPKNGSIFGYMTTFPNTVTFTCDEGFILKGSKVRQCQANRTWTGNDTYCDAVDCGLLRAPLNGSFSGNLTVFPNSVKFECDLGFILSGSALRTCQAHGTWGGLETKCIAIDCGPLPVPKNGSVFGEKTIYPNLLRFKCDEGFTLYGSHKRKCQANGTWNGINTFCQANDCGPLSVPMNGTLSGNLTTYPNKVIFTCDEGFILQGSTIRKCQPDKRWSGNDTICEAVDCGVIKAPMNGSLSGNLTVFPNSAQFACDPGFILSGSALRTCQANGTWGGLETTCNAVNCGFVQPPRNGSVLGEITTYPNLLRFYCDQGFTLYGSSARKCQENGAWSGSTAFCQANDCGPLSVPMNGTLSGNLSTYPNKVTFTCDEGFILRGSVTRQCQPNKRWSGNDTLCEAKDCGLLAVPTNGSSVGSQTTFPNQIIFSCGEGFILRGSVIRKCQSDGTWSGNGSFCEAKDCGVLVTPTNGSLFGNLTTYPHQVKFACDKGFNLRGSKMRQCLSTGNWSGDKTLCEAEDCGPLHSPTNGSSSGEKTTYPNKMTFSCDDGFLLRGSVMRKCQPNGTWSGDVTFCEAKNCGLLRAPINGSTIGDQFTFPNKISLECDEGFILKGSDLRQCQASGEWSGNDTFCEAVDCGPLSSPLNGSLSGDLTVYPNSVRFECDPGYILRGSSSRMCQSNGKWDGYDTVCEAVDCGKLHAPQNGAMVGEETTYPNTLQFSCDEGFILKGSWLRKCQANGTWSGNATKCQAIDCGPLPEPTNGSSSGDSTVFPNTVLFNCDPGFILAGSSTRTCQPNGTWSGLSPLCAAVDCGQPQPLQNGSITGESTVYPNVMQLSCDEGFILRGPPKIGCQTNGTWSKMSSFCQAKDCGPLAVPLNGSYTGRETTFPNEASFSCDEGFILNGSTLRRCEADGSWSGYETACQAVDCDPLSVPMNGSSSGDSTVFPNSVLFNCDPGFILSGSAKRMCQANGTWSGLATTCVAKDCGPLPNPTNGSFVGDLTIFPNKIIFGCDEGFNLRGSYIRHCQENGTWSGIQTLCEAVDCGPLLVPMNGTSSGDSTVFPNSVLFNCDPGFIRSGSSKRTCQANGTWSGFPTVCSAVDCGPLSVPMNGTSSGDSTVFPNSVLFNCDPGFIRSGSSKRTCQANGTWSGLSTACIAVDCGQPQPLQNGSISGGSTVYPNTMHFSCDEGFILRGAPKIKCQTNGTWSKPSSFCEAKDCGPLAVPSNGSLTGNKTTFPNKATFSCDDGFILNGSSVRRCKTDGSWGGTQTSCKAVDCGPLLVPMNGSSSGDSTVFPNKVLFNCDPGFILSGSTKRMCQANGTWSGLLTACVALDCGPLLVPINGSSIGDLTIFPNKIQFGCDEGFDMRGSHIRRCQESGTWSGIETFCEAVDCGPLPVPMNGSSSGDFTVFPNSVLFECDRGFIRSGSSKRTCQANRTWSGFPTVCSAVDCGPLSVPMNGSYSGNSTVFPNNVLFNCDPGFILNGSSTRTCQANGIWSGLSTTCAAVDCGQPQPLQNGSVTGGITVYPNVMHLSCHKGFILRGSPTIQCQTNGTWSKTSSFCEAKDCGPLAVPLNGSYTGRETTFPNEATFSCDEGFILNGSVVRRCLWNGSWSGIDTSCEALDCGPLPVPTNGSSSGDFTVFPNSVLFNCDPGFILNGSSRRTCQANGTWGGFPVLCVAVDCGEPQPLQNGSVTGQSTVYPDVMELSCDEGFILRGSPKIQCQTNGTWSKTLSFCEAKDCGPLTVPLNGSYTGRETTFPNEVSFGCDEGFILNGSVVRHCLSNGSWSGSETSCEAVDCGPLSVPMNGSSSGDSRVFPDSVLFDCDPGFILNGSSTRTCQSNGTWSGLSTVCVAQDCGPLLVPRNGSSVGDLTIFPNKIRFDCDDGFNLRGSDVRQCQANGMWSGNKTFCEAVDCGPLSVPMNGFSSGDSTVFPNSVLFNCDPGFILSGSSKRTCQANGTWSGYPTVCDAVDCGPLPVPMNGSSSGDSTVFPNSVLFNCDPGFILNGSSTRTCQVNGTWNGFTAVCVAVDCGQSQPFQNGSVTGESTVYPDVMELSCDDGFILRGSPMIKCQTNGTWSKTSSYCKAKDCGTLTVPLNGSITGRETTFPNEAAFSCDEGFILNGSTLRRCQADASWSGTETSCQAVDCGPLLVPRNGALFGNLTFFPNSVQFSCNNGYVLIGSFSRQCLANGTWSGMQTACTPIDCGPPQPLRNGTLSGERTVYPNIVRLTCDMGFILRGPPLIQCLANRTWSWTGAFCDVKNCGQLSKPLNGTVIGSETTYPNTVEFKCDEGFELQGPATRKCEADGQWSGEEARCQAVDCGQITVPEYAISHGNSSKYPSIITFSCKQGFSVHGESTRKCKADGKWTSEEVLCQGMDCGLLAPPEHGWMFGFKTTHPHNVAFTCRTGYRLVGSSQRTCLRNGSWSGQQPKCLEHWCNNAPEVPVFAYQTWRATRVRYEHDERLYYSCKPGFILSGIPVRQCILGQWSALKFRCSAPSCNAPTIPKLSYVTSARGSQSKHLDGEKVYYSCHSGYELVGIPEIECQNGVWTNPLFSCQPVSCGTLPKPSNGTIHRNTGTTYTSLYVFRCNVAHGYLVRGSAERRCLANATWSGVQPVCYLQSCDAPGQPRYGGTPELRNKYFFGNTVQYQCSNGFSVRGHETTRCQIHGNWSNPVPECISCSSPLGLKNRMIFSSQLSASSERDSRHGAKHGRLHGNSAWCSARSSLAKYFQIDFGRTTEVTAVATQGHPREYKWVKGYVLQYSLGKHWLTYQESGRDKVFQGNRNKNTVVKYYLKELLVTKRLRILRRQNSQDFMGSAVCLRAEVYGCYYESGCLTVGSEVFARWHSVKKLTRYFHGFVTKVRKTSVEVTPSGNHGARVKDIVELPRAEKHYVIIDKQSKPADITAGAEVIVASEDRIGFARGKVLRIFAKWYEVELGNGKKFWSKARDIRFLEGPVYCDRE